MDLAGSERLEKSGVAGDKERLRETQNINKSLSALGDVIAALGEKGDKGDKHIPYRNSKVSGVYLYVVRCADGLSAYIFVAKFVEREFEDIGELTFLCREIYVHAFL